MHKERLRIVYFTCVPLNDATNGGRQCCRNHLERLNADPDLELNAIAAGPAGDEAGTLEYFRSRGIDGRFIAYKQVSRSSRGAPRTALPWATGRWPYLNEVEAREQNHVDRTLRAYVIAREADCILIDYLPSAYFVPSLFLIGTPVVSITLNREADFYQEMVDRKITLYGRPANRIAKFRLRLAEARIHWSSRAVATIGRHDMPRRFLGRPRTFWIPPYLDPKAEPWSYSGSQDMFFVGNQGHFPNRDAIEWLATQFAPRLAGVAPSMRLKIVGASQGEVPEAWNATNVDYLGFADQAAVSRLFQLAAAFIAPISNNFGAKFKVAEAIAYGTPLLVPESAMSGVPFLPWLSRIRLDRPLEAARAAKTLIENAEAQRTMSANIRDSAAEFIRTQGGIWGRQLRSCGIEHN